MPATWRANSLTATCMPRQMPRYGIPCSRAICAAWILPSQPRPPKPPGIRIPSALLQPRARPPSRRPTRSRPSRSRPCSRGARPRGAAPRRPTGRRPRAGRTCRPARSGSCGATSLARRVIRSQPLEVGRPGLEPEVLAKDELVDALRVEPERHLVDVVHVVGGDHRLDRKAREQRDLATNVGRQLGLGAAHDHVGRDADPSQLVDRVLRRLGLQLARVADVGDQRQVDEHAAPAADVDRELADRLQERQRLDVADRAADLGDDEVDVAGVGHQLDPLLDLVGDVGHDLHRCPEVVAATLAADHGVVDPAGGDVGGAARVGVGEALVVAEIEVGLGAVLGHEHLAVLVGRHRAGVDVDVGVELLQLDVEPASDQEPTDRCCGDALAERGDDSARDEDEARVAVSHRRSSSLTWCRSELGSPAAAGSRRRHAARSSSRACSLAALSSSAAPSIRTSSPTTASPSSIATVVVAGRSRRP